MAWCAIRGFQIPPHTVRHYRADKAEVMLSTISDPFLRGTSNLQLLQQALSMNPRVRFIGTAMNRKQAEELVRKGAYGCVCPSDDAAPRYFGFLESSLANDPD